ncbi:MAG: hypothetical protein E5X43_03670 [Mesorhizobium sp.]|nr:MAG: hypothetical protein E5X43_03670 [Mesorhizobium sp.]
MPFADRLQPAVEVASRPPLLGNRLEVEQKTRGRIVAGSVAAIDFGLHLAPYGFAAPHHRIEPGAAGVCLFRLPPFPFGLPPLALLALASLADRIGTGRVDKPRKTWRSASLSGRSTA